MNRKQMRSAKKTLMPILSAGLAAMYVSTLGLDFIQSVMATIFVGYFIHSVSKIKLP
jgi:hypothetical protein